MAFRKYTSLAEANERIQELEQALRIFKAKSSGLLNQAKTFDEEVWRFASNLEDRKWCKRVRQQSKR